MCQFWSRLLILPDEIIVRKKYICIMRKVIHLKKLFYIRKGPGIECIQTPEEMIQYLEKTNQNKQIN